MKYIALLFIMLLIVGCSTVSVEYGDARVTSTRLFVSQDLSGLNIITPDGVKVILDKKTDSVDEVRVQELSQAIAEFIGTVVE